MMSDEHKLEVRRRIERFAAASWSKKPAEQKAPFEKKANEDKERYVKECEAGALTAPCNGAFVPICMPWLRVARLTTQPSAMFLGSTSLREWAVSLGCQVPTNGAGGFHPFFKELKLFPGHPESTVLPDDSPGKRYEEWPLTDEQWETPAYCNTYIDLQCGPPYGVQRWHASNGAYLTVRDLVNAIAESMGSDYDDEFYTIWAGLAIVPNKMKKHTFEPKWQRGEER